ncbi:MAG: hypothetical protein ABSG37_11715 [Candidatus Limnocylindrales bacterium]
MRRIFLPLLFAVAAVTACGSSNATQAPGGNATRTPAGAGQPTPTMPEGGGDNATATIVLNGDTFNLAGGDCEDAGVLGWEVTVGDYSEGQSGPGDFLDIIVNTNKVSGAQGRAGGVYWALGDDQTGSVGSGMTGNFSGTDPITGTFVQGTFACN